MTYKIVFTKSSLKEFNQLDHTTKEILKKKLKERTENPRILKDKLSSYNDVYKIKLRSIGYRLIYKIIDNNLVILVLTVGKRENNEVYEQLKNITE